MTTNGTALHPPGCECRGIVGMGCASPSLGLPNAPAGDEVSGDAEALRDVLAAHFIMWRDLNDLAGPSGEWRCSCGKGFGFSDSAIDHQRNAVAAYVAAERDRAAREALRGVRFRVEVACDGYAALTVADVPDEAIGMDDLDAYRLGAAHAAAALRAVLHDEPEGTA